MTALPERRRRATWIGVSAAVSSVVATVALAVAGSNILADSTAGRVAADVERPALTLRLPFTSTALIGVIDDEGTLTTLVIAALEPDGTGGSIVQVPVAADPSSGLSERLAPLDAVLAAEGTGAFLRAVDQLTGLSFDVIELVDERRFAELVEPLGDLEIELSSEVRDGSTGETWAAGEQRLAGSDAASVLTAVDPGSPSWAFESVRADVWRSIADRVGAGIGSAEPVADDTLLVVPTSLDEFLDRLFAGPVGFRSIRFEPVAADDAAVRLEPALREALGSATLPGSVIVDRADRLLVLGSVAPTRLGAPLDGPTVRIVFGWSADSFEAGPIVVADLLTWIVEGMIFGEMNVVSVVVASYPGEFPNPEVTRVGFRDADAIPGFTKWYSEPFGGVEATVVDSPIDGVDLELVVGRALVDTWAAQTMSGTATVDGEPAEAEG